MRVSHVGSAVRTSIRHRGLLNKRVPAPQFGFGNHDENPWDIFTSEVLGGVAADPTNKAPTAVVHTTLASTTSRTTPTISSTALKPSIPIRPLPSTSSAPSLAVKPPTVSNPPSSASPTRRLNSASTTTPNAPLTPISAALATVSSSASITGAASSSHVSGAVIGVTLAIVLVGAIGALAWFIRRRMISKRDMRRNTWSAGLYPALETKGDAWKTGGDSQMRNTEKKSLLTDLTPGIDKPLPIPHLGPEAAHRQSSSPSMHHVLLTPPPSTFNNPSHAIYQTPNTKGVSKAATYEIARVRRGFQPALPDELSISHGESIQLITSYDDGWCLCVNGQGERGMVPLECLSRGKELESDGEMLHQDAYAGQWRMSRRASSLYAGITPQGGY